jgi:polysaccharide export outer membrane protein
MQGRQRDGTILAWLVMGVLVAATGCTPSQPQSPPEVAVESTPDYRVGPGDVIEIFVWRNPELSLALPVRPDGRISTPLVEDLEAAGKTPTELARDIEEALATYVKSPVVTVIVTGFSGPYSDQIRVVGEAAQPMALPYREEMSVLDVMIAVGGLTPFADGNRATIIRRVDGEQQAFGVRLFDLVNRGDIAANVSMLPGDVLIIPESVF